MQLLNVDTV